MILEINGQNAELKFGIGFIRKMDVKHEAKVGNSGIKFGAGLILANLGLTQYNPVILADIIMCATKGYTARDIDNAIEDYAEEHGDLEGLFEEVKEELGKSPVVKTAMEKMKTQEQVTEEKED